MLTSSSTTSTRAGVGAIVFSQTVHHVVTRGQSNTDRTRGRLLRRPVREDNMNGASKRIVLGLGAAALAVALAGVVYAAGQNNSPAQGQGPGPGGRGRFGGPGGPGGPFGRGGRGGF